MFLGCSPNSICPSDPPTCTLQVWLVTFPEQLKCLRKEAEICLQANTSHYVPEPELFHRIFPYHVVLDDQLRVVQIGTGLRRMIPELYPGAHIADHLEVKGVAAKEESTEGPTTLTVHCV